MGTTGKKNCELRSTVSILVKNCFLTSEPCFDPGSHVCESLSTDSPNLVPRKHVRAANALSLWLHVAFTHAVGKSVSKDFPDSSNAAQFARASQGFLQGPRAAKRRLLYHTWSCAEKQWSWLPFHLAA